MERIKILDFKIQRMNSKSFVILINNERKVLATLLVANLLQGVEDDLFIKEVISDNGMSAIWLAYPSRF